MNPLQKISQLPPPVGWPEGIALILCMLPAAYIMSQIASADVQSSLLVATAAGLIAAVSTYAVIPNAAQYFLRRNLKGRDYGKRGTPVADREIPSALGLVSGVVYMVIIIVSQLVVAAQESSPELLSNYNAALLSICFMILLGFADDVLDLPWRYKLVLPTVASLPLLCSYSGYTTVLLPKFTRALVWSGPARSGSLTVLGQLVNIFATVDSGSAGALVDLGLFYYVYMGLLAVFATNSINIYAGINGLEAGQALIIGIAVLTANLLELWSGQGASSPHLFSALLALPFIGTTAGLLGHNAFPASVFVGDTYCYFAGMAFAVMGILGHFSKTLLLFFLPQIINFLYSIPQLIKIYPCPRHRLPAFDPSIAKLRPSRFTVPSRSNNTRGDESSTTKPTMNGDIVEPQVAASRRRRASVASPARQRKRQSIVADAGVERLPESEEQLGVIERDNMTLINLVLRITGPMSERMTVNVLLLIQIASCVLGLALRYWMSSTFYTGANEREIVNATVTATTGLPTAI